MIIKILGTPIALKRHRSFLRAGHISHYDPQEKEKKLFINEIKKCIDQEKIPDREFYKVQIIFTFPFPKSRLRKNTPDIKTIPHNTKPDLDNLIKFVLDCGNGILWQDDKKIIDLICSKSYDHVPSTRISIHEVS